MTDSILTTSPVFHDKQGDRFLAINDFLAAWQQYLQAFNIREKMRSSSDLQVSLDKLDRLLDKVMQENPGEAAPFLEKALPIWQRLRGTLIPKRPFCGTTWTICIKEPGI